MVYHKFWLCSYCCPIIDMFMTENMSKHFDQPVNLKILDADCSYKLLGSLSCVEIFQTIPVSVKYSLNSTMKNFKIHV